MNKKIIFGIIFAIGILIFGLIKLEKMPGKYDNLASCLAEKEAFFYGSFKCPACQKQKALFGKSKKYLPYVECTNLDGTPTEACEQANIERYPTWIFQDESVLVGIKTPLELAEITGCEFPFTEEEKASIETLIEDTNDN